MVTHVHSILRHVQVRLFVQITREGDGVLLYKRHHWYPMVGEVEVAHVSDRSIPMVERAPMIDDLLTGIGTRDRRDRRRLLPLHQDDG